VIGPVDRVLIVRLSSIGDVVHTLPVLCALRARFPHAYLAWLCEDPGATLLDGHPALDELVRVPTGWLTWLRPRLAARTLLGGRLGPLAREIPAVRQRLRALRVDLTIDTQGRTRSAVSAWLSGARWRIGAAGRKGQEWTFGFNNRRIRTRAVHAVDRALELLRPLGIIDPRVEFRLEERPEDGAWAERCRRETGLGGDFALIAAGTSWPSKCWPPARFAAVARHLGERHRSPVGVVGVGAEERRRADAVVDAASGHARLVPEGTLPGLAALARRARLFVGADTGPLHVAAAVGAPCVGLYGPTRPEITGPYGPGHIVIKGDLPAGVGPVRPVMPGDPMAGVDVDRVLAACDTLLGRPPRLS
jgi:lipopolysaccharide heptosyltransferase I